MVQVPDSAKSYVDGLVKFHFWILAAIVPLALIPSVFSANESLSQRIKSQKSNIDGHVSALQAIQSEGDHPNAEWVKEVDKRTSLIRDEILQEWQRFWASQKSLRVWPEELGPDFLEMIHAVEAGKTDRLDLKLLQRYQNDVPAIVRKLPARMGSKELMSESQFGSGGLAPQPGSRRGTVEEDTDSPEASLQLDPLVWRAEDQKRLLASFTWHREPSTTQVRLAQEELWVYGIFCDAIRELNKGARGAFDATITSVEELAVGYPAAEEVLGGQGGGRILWKVDPKALSGVGGVEGEAPPPMTADPVGGPITRPINPRFDASSADSGGGFSSSSPAALAPPPTPGMEGAEGLAVPTSPDDGFYEWIYVDFAGRPLTASAVKTAKDSTMAHLVPFTLRVVVDQRKVDRLLQALAENAIPIDVRQVRINPSSRGGTGSNLLEVTEAAANDGGEGARRRRPFDVTLELRGSVGLATPPDAKPLGGGEPVASAEGGGS